MSPPSGSLTYSLYQVELRTLPLGSPSFLNFFLSLLRLYHVVLAYVHVCSHPPHWSHWASGVQGPAQGQTLEWTQKALWTEVNDTEAQRGAGEHSCVSLPILPFRENLFQRVYHCKPVVILGVNTFCKGYDVFQLCLLALAQASSQPKKSPWGLRSPVDAYKI